MTLVIGLWTCMLCVFFSVYWFADWISHRNTIRSRNEIYGKAKYSDFVREFQKYNWRSNEHDQERLEDKANQCELYFDNIRMNNIGMMMKTPWDWFLIKMYVRHFIKTKNELYDWSKGK